ncbi:hypothetical protein MMC16_006850 [Acarospora aff. strigata]|nr:hypothetical protein [Acarospora aff. strigata]
MAAAVQPRQSQPLTQLQAISTAPPTSVDNTINAKKRSGSSDNQTRKKVKTAKADTMKAATRPLNSWMAFRSYYSPMFTSLQQKDISGVLTYLWQSDPFKAKWSILAKAYSTIRDQKGKKNARLDSFLLINAPYIGIIPPTEYLDIMGWKFSTDKNNQTTLTRNADTDSTTFDQDLLTTNLSVEDIIQHCYDVEYISADGDMVAVNNGSTMTMATTAQPTVSSVQVVPQAIVASAQQSAPNMSSDSAPAGSANTEDENTAATAIAEEDTVEKEFEKQLLENMLKGMEDEDEKEEVTNHAAQLGNDVLGQVLLESGDEFPFNSQFDPEDSTDLHYDPFMGDPFNPFDMSEYLNEDMFGAN